MILGKQTEKTDILMHDKVLWNCKTFIIIFTFSKIISHMMNDIQVNNENVNVLIHVCLPLKCWELFILKTSASKFKNVLFLILIDSQNMSS